MNGVVSPPEHRAHRTKVAPREGARTTGEALGPQNAVAGAYKRGSDVPSGNAPERGALVGERSEVSPLFDDVSAQGSHLETPSAGKDGA